MSLPSRAAALRGDDYHHAVAWLWVCKMLRPSEMISSVAVEDAAGGAFDDVVVRRRVGGDIYIQAKNSNYGNKIIDRAWLLTANTAGGRSPLQRYYDTYLRLSEAGERFTLEVWTTRGFDHANPLLGRLLDRKHDKIASGRMLTDGARSAVGKERDEWAAHLEVSVENLARFLDTVRWKHTASELDVRRQAKPYMALAGLRDDEGALTSGIGIVRDWASDGLGPQTPADAGRCIVSMRLTAAGPLQAYASSDGTSVESSLPPGCRDRVDELRRESPEAADRVVSLLSVRSSRVPGILAHLADEPLGWMVDADSLVWESLAEFVQAHGLPGVSAMRCRAIAAGSRRSALYSIQLAVAAAAEEGRHEQVEDLLREVSSEHPLLEPARAHINDDAEAAIAAIGASMLHKSDDPDLALYGAELLVWAYWRLSELESALAVLRQASERFLGRGFLLQQQAKFMLSMATRTVGQQAQHHDLLESAVELATRARDEFRVWGGSSARAVSLAAEALLVLDEPERVRQLTAVQPEGEATLEEAEDAWVVAALAHALLALGRVNELDKLNLEAVDGSEGVLIRALRARDLGDANALHLMRAAVGQAKDERERLMALDGLALFGEIDEEALTLLEANEDDEAARIRASAAYSRGNYAAAADLLMPYRCRSADHAELLAACQRKSGALDDACETLLECAEALDDPSLHSSAVRRLIEAERYEQGERVALGALARNPPRVAEVSLRRSLVEVAENLEDWPAMEQYGRDLVRQFPDLPMGPWSVVYALPRQARYREAWGYLVEHDLSPDNENVALLAVSVYIAMDAPAQDAHRLLRVARMFPECEEVVGNAIGALMIGKGGRVKLSEAQLSELRDLAADFEERFPESVVLRRHSFDEVEPWLEMIRSKTQQRSLDMEPILRDVRHGRMPYGMLQAIAPVPYAESLQLRAAGHLTAVSADVAVRQRERAAARASIGNVVAVDTSVAVLGVLAELDLPYLATAFNRVLVADELLIDARNSVTSAGTPAAGYAGYEPLVDDVVVSWVEDLELEKAVALAEQVAAVMGRWQREPSGRLQLTPRSKHPALRPWDASVRVASNRSCALWCDDLALRHLAESEGVATFGTYALYEVLALEQGNNLLPMLRDIQIRLLREMIADVPMSMAELREAADDSDGPDPAVGSFLSRPFSWQDASGTLGWYLDRVQTLVAASSKHCVPDLLFSASCGLGSAVAPADRQEALGQILAATLWTVGDPTMSPMLLKCSRLAARRIDPLADVDPLSNTVRGLLERLEADIGAGMATQTAMFFFSEVDSVDKRTVASAILEDR